MNPTNNKLTTAAAAGSTAAALQNAVPSAAEKNKQWQRELLMERLRSHTSQQRSFPELSKAMRMSMLEKRYALDAVEKSNLQKCLDSMQHCIKVTSRQGLVERLESLSRQLGLKFMEDTSGLFISTDMFFLEIILDASGALSDVKVHHECKIEQQSCSELVNCLKRGDFADFTVQLEGLSSIYQLNAEPKVKTKAFVALQAMETDLYNLFQMQNFNVDAEQLIKDSAVGLVLKRRGGHPMKLTYFISPYDLLSLETKSLQSLSIDLITEKQIGLNVTVNLEASSANKLQILPTVTFSKDSQTGVDMPVYAPLTQANSMLLPATFVLRLNKPLPVCYMTLSALGVNLAGATELGSSGGSMESQHKAPPAISTIMNLIVQTASEQQLKSSQKALFVALPDQTHCYFFTENKQLKATLVSSVPFTEPSQVPKILGFLKSQALFYTLVASCVRSQTKMGNDMESTIILEVNAVSFHQISVALQHPYEESMATVEFDLRDGNVHCTIFSLSRNYDLFSLKLTKIIQKCLSIPVTIRALLKFWDQESMNVYQRSIGGGSSAATGSGGGVGMNQHGNNSGVGGGGNTAGGNGGFGNFSLAMGPNDSGGGRNIGSSGVGNGSGVMKMETSPMRMDSNPCQPQEMEQQNANAVTAVAGFLKFKNELQNNDYHEGVGAQPQANGSMMQQSLETGTLGHNQQPQQHQPLDAFATTTKASDIEIADKYKNIWKDKTPNLKNCVSITPISAEAKTAAQQSVDVKRTGGIEIIPLTAQATAAAAVSAGSGLQPTTVAAATLVIPTTTTTPSASSTITITPINASAISSASLAKEKKSSSGGSGSSSTSSNSSSSSSSSSTSTASSSSGKRSLDPVIDAAQKEKKRKKKRDDSPMGPPEKVYSRQNSPAANSDAAVTVAARKFSSPSSSPKGGSGGSILVAGGVAANASLSTRPSPKHSPVYSSPKHNTASNSPKSPFGTHSPKHGSSGKPSMSTLKSAAATSLSPKGDKTSGSSAAGLGMGVGVGVERSTSVPNVNATSSALLRTFLNNSAAAAAAAGAGVGGASSMSVGGGQTNAVASGSNIPAVVATASKQRDKEQKLSLSSPIASAAGSSLGGSAAAAAAAAAVTSAGMKLAVMQQQLRTAGLSHLATAGNLSGYAGAAAAAAVAAAGVASAMDSIRKGAVGAVSLMMPTATTMAPTARQQHPQQRQQLGSNESHTPSNESSTEYMVKPSQEGLKLTINKTNNRNSNKSSSSAIATTKTKSSASSLSKRQRTGLKPGVNAGPASKKSNLSLSTSVSESWTVSSAPSTTKKSQSPSAETLTSPSSSSLTPSQTISSFAATVGAPPTTKSSTIINAKHIFQKSVSDGNLAVRSSVTANSNSLTAETGAIRKTTNGGNLHSKKLTGPTAAVSSSLPSLTESFRTDSYTLTNNRLENLKFMNRSCLKIAVAMEGMQKSLHQQKRLQQEQKHLQQEQQRLQQHHQQNLQVQVQQGQQPQQQQQRLLQEPDHQFHQLQHEQQYLSMQQLYQNNPLPRIEKRQRSPPPSYNASVAAANATVVEPSNNPSGSSCSEMMAPANIKTTTPWREASRQTMHSLASAPTLSAPTPSRLSHTQSMQSSVTLRIDATVDRNRHRHQHQHELQQPHTVDDFLELEADAVPSTSTSDSVSASVAARPMSAITSINEQFIAEVVADEASKRLLKRKAKQERFEFYNLNVKNIVYTKRARKKVFYGNTDESTVESSRKADRNVKKVKIKSKRGRKKKWFENSDESDESS